MTMSWASRLYLARSSALIMIPSRPFKAAMLSAKRQFTGMVGAWLPVNLILRAYSLASGGRSFAIRGFSRMPVRSNLFDSSIIEYSRELLIFSPIFMFASEGVVYLRREGAVLIWIAQQLPLSVSYKLP